MSNISFITFCVENYAVHTNQPGFKVYQLFKDKRLLETIEEDYDQLHGMGIEYLMLFFDNYLGEKAK